jgi:hypothetical protein
MEILPSRQPFFFWLGLLVPLFRTCFSIRFFRGFFKNSLARCRSLECIKPALRPAGQAARDRREAFTFCDASRGKISEISKEKTRTN